MSYKLSILALIQIVSAVSIGVAVLSTTYKILQYIGRRYYRIEEQNLAYSIFTASIMFSVGFMMNGVLQPLLSFFRILNNSGLSSWSLLGSYVFQGAVYIGIAYASVLIISILGSYLYSRLTPLDEFQELRDNRVGVAIMIGAMIICLTLMSKDGVILLLESIVPYPELPPR